MELDICQQLINGENVPINAKGCETINIELADIRCLSIGDRDLRLISFDKNGLYRLTLKSFKVLKRELNKRGLSYRYN